jgi:competence protein ComEC
MPVVGRAGGRLEIHAIDVGQGDAFAIRTPHDRWLLIDTGPLNERFDAGRDRIAPYLRRLGVHAIEFVLLTHPHADHIGGVASIWNAFDVGAVIDPAVPAAETVYRDVVRQAAAEHWRWLEGRAGREFRLDDVSITLLAPDDSLLDDLDDPNDYSIVVRLEYGRFAALFLGDAPVAVEDRLVGRYGPGLAAQVVKVGHHGSRTSTGDSLLDAAHPQLALVSVGRRNRYGHPNPEVMQRLTRHGVRIVRTDFDGSVIVRAAEDGTSELLKVR